MPARDSLTSRLAALGGDALAAVIRTMAVRPADDDAAALPLAPVCHEVPGMPSYEWVRRLREPSYALARAHRGGDGEDGA